VNGEVANYRPEAIAHIDYDPTTTVHLGSADFIFL
jgi:hypothetical protein